MASAASGGSRSRTSSPAPAMSPCRKARTRSAWFTIRPRATLIRNAVGFIFANTPAFIMPSVAGISGTWTET